MKEGKSACWYYSTIWCSPSRALPIIYASYKDIGIQGYTDIAITTASLLTVLTSILLFDWATFFAWRNMRLSGSSVMHGTKSVRCQMVPYLSS